jgi:hypothetical protein
MTLYKFEIIVTNNKEQFLLYLDINKNINEDDFILTILRELDKNDLESLLKLSCYQLNGDILDFILLSNGKYYFNKT